MCPAYPLNVVQPPFSSLAPPPSLSHIPPWSPALLTPSLPPPPCGIDGGHIYGSVELSRFFTPGHLAMWAGWRLENYNPFPPFLSSRHRRRPPHIVFLTFPGCPALIHSQCSSTPFPPKPPPPSLPHPPTVPCLSIPCLPPSPCSTDGGQICGSVELSNWTAGRQAAASDGQWMWGGGMVCAEAVGSHIAILGKYIV